MAKKHTRRKTKGGLSSAIQETVAGLERIGLSPRKSEKFGTTSEDKFIDAIKRIRTESFLKNMDNIRREGQSTFVQPDWIWTALIKSAATLGRVPKMEVLESLRHKWSWNSIVDFSDAKLIGAIEDVYEKSGVRFASRKAKWSAKNRSFIARAGGPIEFKKKWLRADRDTAISMLDEFKGVSKKYARNIGMDVGDSRFENCVALDVRLLTILRSINPKLRDKGRWYEETEEYFRYLATKIGISPWSLDRTIFRSYEELKSELVS